MSNKFCITFYKFLQRFEHWVLTIFFIAVAFAIPFALFYAVIDLTWQLSIIATLGTYVSIGAIYAMAVLYDRGERNEE